MTYIAVAAQRGGATGGDGRIILDLIRGATCKVHVVLLSLLLWGVSYNMLGWDSPSYLLVSF